MGIQSRWCLVLQRWSSRSRKFITVFHITRQMTITAGCGRQYGCSGTKDSINGNTVGCSGTSGRWLAGKQSGRKAMHWAVENVCSFYFVMKTITNVWLIRVLQEELVKLGQLSKEWIGRKVADYEDEKSQITEIFEHVNEPRIQFGVSTASIYMWCSNWPSV